MNLEFIESVFTIILLAWFIVELEPLQLIFERLAEKSGIFNVVFYKVFSCWRCLSFWISVIFHGFGIELGEVLYKAILAAFLIWIFKKIRFVK